MVSNKATTLGEIVKIVRSAEIRRDEGELVYRGQGSRDPLLPAIARRNPTQNTTRREKEMLLELRRRAFLSLGSMEDLALMVYAQHHGMATRLLDWTTNPLVAVWFACQDAQRKDLRSAYVYGLLVEPGDFVGKEGVECPLSLKRTMVHRPTWNNDRVAAQQGMFTIHAYAGDPEEWIPLEKNSAFGGQVWEIEIAGKAHIIEILRELDLFGVNHESVFPGVEGTCRYITWKNRFGARIPAV